MMNISLTGKKVLVTGGAGFIGSHTVDECIKREAKVIVVDNLSTGSQENINPMATFYECNIADNAIETLIHKEQPDYVFHFAFYVLVPKSVENPLLDIDCIEGSIRMLQALRKTSVKKIVFASSGFLYGNTKNLPAKESEPVSPISPYIISKAAIENYLAFYRSAYGLDYVILRYPAVYGSRQVTGAMADYIRKLSSGEQAEIWGDGSKTRDYIYIDDVIRANMLALNISRNYKNPLFNIGTGVETTLSNLYTMIAALLNKDPKPIFHPDRPGEQMRYCLDATKMMQTSGWAPEIDINTGLRLLLSSKGLV